MYDYKKYSTLTDTIIAFLVSARSTREFHRVLRERAKNRYKRATVDSTLSLLKQKGIVVKTNAGWRLTALGKTNLEKESLFDLIPSPFSGSESNNVIVAFDIPENARVKRNWLRNQLKVFGYKMFQQSVWLGPGPLPKAFKDRIKKLALREQVKMFSLQK